MGCFPFFDSREEEKLNPNKERDDHTELQTAIPSNISKLSSGGDRLKSRSNVGPKREMSALNLSDSQIAAQTFSFRELAAATNNFRPESFLGEGGFGRVYKLHLNKCTK